MQFVVNQVTEFENIIDNTFTFLGILIWCCVMAFGLGLLIGFLLW